jgi:hypothetical protein
MPNIQLKRNCIRTGLSNPPRASLCYAARDDIFILCLYRKSGTVLQVGTYDTYREFYACVLQKNPPMMVCCFAKEIWTPLYRLFPERS